MPVASTTAASPEVAALVTAYCNHHRNVENYILVYRVVLGLVRRLRQEPMSARGRVLAMLLVALLLMAGPLCVTAILDEWAAAPIAIWTIVVAGFSLLTMGFHRSLLHAIDAFLSLHRNIVEREGIVRLCAFEARWFRLSIAVPFAVLFSFGIHVYLYFIEVNYQERQLTWGTAVLTMLLLYQVGEVVYAIVLLALESRLLPSCQYALYRLSPIDTVALRRSLRGTNQLVGLVSVVTTGIIIGFVLLLEDRPIFLTRVGLLLLGCAYVTALAALLLPRLSIKAIVHRAKENQLGPLQGRLSELVTDASHLSEDDFKELKRIKEVHDMLRDASEEVLPMRAVGRLFGALLFPTMTFLVSRFGEHFLLPMLRR